MASSSKTTNGLNYWSKDDIPMMTDFNSDNTIIDAAISKANDPLAQIGEGGIPASYLADGALGFSSVVPAAAEFGTLPALTPDGDSNALYIYAGDHITLSNDSESAGREQIRISGKNLISYINSSSDNTTVGIDKLSAEGIYAIKPLKDAGTVPERLSEIAILIMSKPEGMEYFSQLWIGKSIYYRIVNNGTCSSWTPVTSKFVNGATASRPSVCYVGQCYFDTTLGLPIWWNGSAWIKADGTEA